MLRNFTRLLLPALILPLVVVGCDETSPMGSDTAEVTLLLTDHPGDVEYVWVEIGEVYLQGGGAPGRHTLLTEEEAAELGEDGLVELTELADRTVELASDVQVSPGRYGQLRFVVQGGVLETEDGEVFSYNAEHPDGLEATGDLICPSCDQTGIKVVLSNNVGNLQAGSHIVLLDFDVAESFGRQAGASGTWVMNPVIRAVEIDFSGGVSGHVDVARDDEGEPEVEIPACPAGSERGVEDFIPRAIAQDLTDDEGDPVVTTAQVAEDGSFQFAYLEPDTYEMGYAESVEFNGAELVFEADVDPSSIDVTSGSEAEVTYTITAASCEEDND